VGLQLLARPFAEGLLLRVAHALAPMLTPRD
jgi:Asp-tRNA(Asn)/Glu-tRNA(Gln) amidotransferase A subunit family amidase